MAVLFLRQGCWPGAHGCRGGPTQPGGLIPLSLSVGQRVGTGDPRRSRDFPVGWNVETEKRNPYSFWRPGFMGCGYNSINSRCAQDFRGRMCWVRMGEHFLPTNQEIREISIADELEMRPIDTLSQIPDQLSSWANLPENKPKSLLQIQHIAECSFYLTTTQNSALSESLSRKSFFHSFNNIVEPKNCSKN